MKSFFLRIKWQYYLITFIAAIILFVIEGARPTHFVLDSPLVYGDLGHIVLLSLTFIASVYLGSKNTCCKWLYPICVAVFIYAVVPYTALLFINQTEVTQYFLGAGWIFFGFIFVFISRLVVPLLGIGLGSLIYRVGKHRHK